jgi:hypothetical protein
MDRFIEDGSRDKDSRLTLELQLTEKCSGASQ